MGGRGVGKFFFGGGVVFGPSRGGNKSCLSEGGEGKSGENPQKIQEATKGGENVAFLDVRGDIPC